MLTNLYTIQVAKTKDFICCGGDQLAWGGVARVGDPAGGIRRGLGWVLRGGIHSRGNREVAKVVPGEHRGIRACHCIYYPCT